MSADFQETLDDLEARIDLPYPARADLIEEIAADLEEAYRARLAEGLAEPEARAAVLADFDFTDDATRELAAVHVPATRRALLRLPPHARDGVEWAAAFTPLFALFLVLSTEVPMAHFLREGGSLSYAVLLVGGFALLLQMHRVFLWFVLRDHSPAALRRNTSTPLYLAAATFVLGVLATSVGFYELLYLEAAPTSAQLRAPIPPVIIGSALAALIVLVQGALQAGLRAMRVPQEKKS